MVSYTWRHKTKQLQERDYDCNILCFLLFITIHFCYKPRNFDELTKLFIDCFHRTNFFFFNWRKLQFSSDIRFPVAVDGELHPTLIKTVIAINFNDCFVVLASLNTDMKY